MNTIRAAQAGQGGLVSIACINKATVDLGVPFDKLTAARAVASIRLARNLIITRDCLPKNTSA